jgi:hypothetical protein
MDPKHVFEMPEGTGAVDGILQICTDFFGADGACEIVHDVPIVDIELGGERYEAVGGDDSFGDLPLVLLPSGKGSFWIAVLGLFRVAEKLSGDSFHLAGIEIKEGRLFVVRKP